MAHNDDTPVVAEDVQRELTTTPWERIQAIRADMEYDEPSAVRRLVRVPFRDGNFWKAFGLCWLAAGVFLLCLSVYRIANANTEETNTSRTETLCRSNYQSALEIANANLIANFSDFASALDAGIPYDDPIRVAIRDERRVLTIDQRKAVEDRENSQQICAQAVGRTVPTDATVSTDTADTLPGDPP